MSELLRIDAETAAHLYLALKRLYESDDADCYCSFDEDWDICAWCEARTALSYADGKDRERVVGEHTPAWPPKQKDAK